MHLWGLSCLELGHQFTHTVFVPVQVAEHDLELFLVVAEILGELGKVQHSVLVGVSIFYNLPTTTHTFSIRKVPHGNKA